jgi:hypothetical protein
VRLFVAVVIHTGEGACARPGGSGYPHSCSLLTRVDSAEADRVGSQRFRFCAYVGLALDEGVWHYRTTPGALNLFPNCPSRAVCLLQAAAATADRFNTDGEEGVASASSAGLPGQAYPPSACPSPRDHPCPPLAPAHHNHLPPNPSV